VNARCSPWVAVVAAFVARSAEAELPSQPTVVGTAETRVHVSAALHDDVDAPWGAWGALATTDVPPGTHWVTFPVEAGKTAVGLPVCAGRKRVLVDGVETRTRSGPVFLDMPADGHEHRVAMELDVSGYEHRIACGSPPVVGSRDDATDGLHLLAFASPHADGDGGRAVVYVPAGHATRRPGALLVGLHPWNGGIWTYAAYEPLLEAARANDVVLLMPSGLGNSLYTAGAEDEVLRAIDALEELVAVDPDRVTLWGASMGGAGATTVGFHHPDRFAAIVSLFGDSKYDLATYVRSVLHDGRGAHLVNALDVVDNARNVPVWLIHGEEDHVSPIQQSAMLARALAAMRFDVTFDRVPGAGHEGRVVSAFAARIVERAARVRRASVPARVSYWSVRPTDVRAYGVRLTRARASGDAFFDLERVGDTVHLRSATSVRALALPRGAFGFAPGETPAIVIDDPRAHGVAIAWDPLP